MRYAGSSDYHSTWPTSLASSSSLLTLLPLYLRHDVTLRPYSFNRSLSQSISLSISLSLTLSLPICHHPHSFLTPHHPSLSSPLLYPRSPPLPSQLWAIPLTSPSWTRNFSKLWWRSSRRRAKHSTHSIWSYSMMQYSTVQCSTA